MSDDELNGIIVQLGIQHRREVVKSLLAGNDTQCFTAQQYAEAYYRIVHKEAPDHKDGWIKWLLELTPRHLSSVGLREVKPGVYAR